MFGKCWLLDVRVERSHDAAVTWAVEFWVFQGLIRGVFCGTAGDVEKARTDLAEPRTVNENLGLKTIRNRESKVVRNKV